MSKSLPLKKHNRLLFFVRLTSCPSDSCSFFLCSPVTLYYYHDLVTTFHLCCNAVTRMR